MDNFLKSNLYGKNWYQSKSWQELILVAAAVKINLFAQLKEKPLAAEQLAKATNCNLRAVQYLLTALVAADYLMEKNGSYSLTPLAKKYLSDPQAKDYLGWFFLHNFRLIQRWLTLPDVLKTGSPEAGDRFTESVEGFIKAMDIYAAATASEVVSLCLQKAPAAKTALDIGGATGTVAKLLARQGLKVTLFDTEAVAELVAPTLPEIKVIGGDFNKSIPDGPYDLIYLGNITHIYGPKNNELLFKNCFQQLNPNGVIAILDYVQGLSPSAPFFAINMLVNTTTGGTWSKADYLSWLKKAGFGAPEIVNLTNRDQQLILAARQ
jgi:SAM-dependent methyltransferase